MRKSKNVEKSKLIYNVKDLRQQDFTLSKCIIKFILKNSNAEVMRKLYQSCKYFYKASPYFIVDKLDVTNDIVKLQSGNHNTTFSLDDYDWLDTIDNIWITESINFNENEEDYDIIPKIKKCDASTIFLSKSRIHLYEFSILVKSINLKSLRCSKIAEPNIDLLTLPIEDLLNLVPNVTDLTVSECHITSETASKLFAMKRTVKFEKLHLKGIDASIDARMFHRFVKNNATVNAEIALRFKEKTNKIFENEFNEICDDEEPAVKKSKINFSTSLRNGKTIKFIHQNMRTQNFRLPKPIMAYIIAHPNGPLFRKLYQTCKYFYIRRPYCIIDKVTICYHDQYFKIGSKRYPIIDAEHLDSFKNIWVIQSVNIDDNIAFVRDMIPKIIQCDAKKIECNDITLSKEAYNILTKSGKVETWNGDECQVLDGPNNLLNVPFEDLMENLVNAKDITFDNCHVTKQTMIKLLAMPWKNKITQLSLTNLDGKIDSDMFYEFMKKAIRRETAYVEVSFNFPNHTEFAATFKAAINKKLEKWKPKSRKPTFLLVLPTDNITLSDSDSSGDETNESEEIES